MKEESISRERAEAICKATGVTFPEDADWFLVIDTTGSETLCAYGYDEPFATNHTSTSWDCFPTS